MPGMGMNGMGGMRGMGGMGMGFGNRWASPGYNYTSMNGYNYVDYSGGWNPMVHDQMLLGNINMVFQRYDMNFNGQL